MPRRACLHLLTCVLALVSAVVLLGAATMVRDAPVAAPRADQTASVVRGFYDAVNHALRSGDTAALEAAVDPDLVVHGSPPEVAPDRAGLIRHLAAVKAAFQGAQLVVEDLVAVEDRAMARVGVDGASEGTFLGLRLRGGPLVWGRLDAVRVAGGRVVELWSEADRLALLEPLSQVPLDPRPMTGQAVALERLDFVANGQQVPGSPVESRVVFVEAGTITVVVDPLSAVPAVAFAAGAEDVQPTAVAPGTELTLSAGDAVALPTQSRYTLRHDGGLPAPVLVAVAFPVYTYTGPLQANGALASTPQDDGDQAAGGGVAPLPLADDLRTALPAGVAIVAFGRATLPPGEGVSVHEAAGPVLLYVESGVLGVEASTGGATDTLVAGDGAIVPAGSAVAIRALGDESAAVLVGTVLPDEAETGAMPRRRPGGAETGGPWLPPGRDESPEDQASTNGLASPWPDHE